MARTAHYYTKFEEGKYYHIYNRAVGGARLFQTPANYIYFLKQFDKYLSNYLEIYAYCLLGNHFHVLIKVPDKIDGFSGDSIHDVISKQFKNFFLSYALSFNKQENRKGTLFQTPFKRALIKDENYLSWIIFYIHVNPEKHKLINDFKNWRWSSYNSIISSKKTKLRREDILEWFGGRDEFVTFHNENRKLGEIEDDDFEV